MSSAIELWRRRPGATVALAVGLMVLVRIVIVVITPFQLGPDEAQYWRWSRTLDWGYYSKPPLIAWTIWLTTLPFGDAEWAIRLSSPILHGGAALALYGLGRAMFDPRTGAWAAAIYLLMPGVFLSSVIMSTDAVLLAFWSLALLALWRLRDKPSLLSGFLFGLALGAAALAKYAALYLLAGAALAAIVDPPTRRALISFSGLAAIAGLALAVAPNLAWNAAHKFATVSHTADNADWSNASVNPMRGLNFLVDQMAVFGPITLIVLLVALVIALLGIKRALKPHDDADPEARTLWLAAFVLPPLLVILVQAVVSRAHANWAATAYPAASVLLASWIARGLARRVLMGGLALNALIGGIFWMAAVAPTAADSIGMSNTLKRVRGWRELTAELGAIARRENATALVFDERELWHGVDYYSRNIPNYPPVRAWQRGNTPRSYAEEAGALKTGEDAHALVVSHGDVFAPMIRRDFKQIDKLQLVSIPLDEKHKLEADLYIASGYAPVTRTPEFEKQVFGEEPSGD